MKLLMDYEVLPIPLTDDEIRYAIFINEYPISLLLQDTNYKWLSGFYSHYLS